MTVDQSLLLARPATSDDRQLIRTLMRSEGYVHTHLDWKPVEDLSKLAHRKIEAPNVMIVV